MKNSKANEPQEILKIKGSVLEEMKNFHKSMKRKITQCSIFYEAWPSSKEILGDYFVCT